jgi:putative DNA primase/helicase
LHVISNELPKLGDASAAIVGRLVLLILSHSWLGKEDHTLEVGLQAELPGILNWALDGLHRLTITNKNRFTHLSSADEAIMTRDLASPVAAFVREKCKTGPDHQVEVDTLYGAYRTWADENGHPKEAKTTFGRNLRAAIPAIRQRQPRDGLSRSRIYAGIALQPEGTSQDSEEAPAWRTKV